MNRIQVARDSGPLKNIVRMVFVFEMVILAFLAIQSRATVSAQPVAFPTPLALPAASNHSEIETDAPEHDNNEADAQKTADTKANAEEAKLKAEAEQLKQKRLQEIKKLKFDRRPSAILQAWSVPPSDDDDAKKGKAEKDKADDDSADHDANAEPEKEPTEQEVQAKAKAEAEQAFKKQIAQLQRDVTLSNWPAVRTLLGETLDDELGKAAYAQLLQSLVQGPQPPRPSPDGRNRRQFVEKNVFTGDDVLALAHIAPDELERAQVISLGNILGQSLRQGTVMAEFVASLKETVTANEAENGATPGVESKTPTAGRLSKRDAARILIVAGGPLEVGDFLPDRNTAESENDHEALNLLSHHYLALYAKDKDLKQLEQAWHVTQAILAADEIKKEEKTEALTRAVDLATKVADDLGQKWLEESFTQRPDRGMEIIAAIGTAASQGLMKQPRNPAFRLKGLQLQATAVESLLTSAPERATEWKDKISLLAENWRKEADFSYANDNSTSLGPQMGRDAFGNLYYYDRYGRSNNRQLGNQPQPIKTGELLEIRPSDAWLNMVHDGLKPTFDMTVAKLYLKVAEDVTAFPYIESLAETHPKLAKDLVDEFVRVWTQNHDPNTKRNRTNYYMYMYGYERKAEGIPLTRSKQQRNLQELSEWVARLKQLPVELDEELIARAFSTCHSSAEVYRLDAIEQVFGPIADIQPETLAEMAQQMRSNLMGVWRAPATQNQAKTNRKKKDIEAEVLRGYGVARSVVQDALEKHSASWQLRLALAAINHDENNYRSELAKDSEFSRRRDEAFTAFEDAAKAYITAAVDLREDEESTKAFEIWYYASLGACDLADINENKQADSRQPKRIRDAILSMPENQADRHMAMFANTLFTRMSSVKPATKHGYLKAGFEIVGDHKMAHEARKVFDYYRDLVTEIKLETVIDGSDVVGHERPFGVFVNLVHTREIERESGGFAKYLQNQNNGSFYYNYGRPTENYRDKFEESVTSALEEQFDVLSVTFQSENVNSRALPEYGWRVTPYAYLLLKARGPEVDKLPPLRLDLDFLDTSGYAVLPVESSVLPIDAKPAAGEQRPIQKLSVTQTLDERQADDGKLIVEVKATGQGLVSDLDQWMEFEPDEFDVVNTEDQGVSVSRFDPDAEQNVILSERIWMVTLHAKQGLSEHPKTFQFATAKPNIADYLHDVTFQRYIDADLESVDSSIQLEEQYGEVSRAWVGWTVGGVIGLLSLLALMIRMSPPVLHESEKRFQVPEKVTPFTVLGLLKDIAQNNGLNDRRRQELSGSINRIEKYYFEGRQEAEEPNIHEIAEEWVRRTDHASRARSRTARGAT